MRVRVRVREYCLLQEEEDEVLMSSIQSTQAPLSIFSSIKSSPITESETLSSPNLPEISSRKSPRPLYFFFKIFNQRKKTNPVT